LVMDPFANGPPHLCSSASELLPFPALHIFLALYT
jgi:hypothetical protein